MQTNLARLGAFNPTPLTPVSLPVGSPAFSAGAGTDVQLPISSNFFNGTGTDFPTVTVTPANRSAFTSSAGMPGGISLAAGAAGTIASVIIGLELWPALLVGGAIALGSEYLQNPQGVSGAITNTEQAAQDAATGISNAATGAGSAISSGLKTGTTLAEMALALGGLYIASEFIGAKKR